MNSGFDNESTTKVNNNISNNSLKDKIMKKFVFAATAAMVMVSVSNVFASSKMMGNSEVAPVDTTVEDTAISSQASVEDSAKQETPVEQVENAQPTEEVKAQDAPVENTQQESTEQAVAE